MSNEVQVNKYQGVRRKNSLSELTILQMLSDVQTWLYIKYSHKKMSIILFISTYIFQHSSTPRIY